MSVEITNQELADGAEQVPPITRILQRLLATLQDPFSDVGDITRLVLIDPAFTAQLLRLANSPQFNLSEPVATVDVAIQHIGLNAVTRLASTLASRQSLMRPLSYYNTSAALLWRHALAVAIGAEVIAERFVGDASLAYITGLLHPTGLIVLEHLATARKLPRRPETIRMLDWEKQRFGADNAEVSARVLRHWNFPPVALEAVSTRYVVPTPETIGHTGAALFLASNIAERIPAGLPPEAGYFQIDEDQLASLGLDPEQWKDLEMEVVRKLSRVRAMFNID